MVIRNTPINKVTISLPVDLLQFADRQAAHLGVSRSQVICQALAQAKLTEEERLAAEGYQFYAGEASEFADASLRSFSEVIGHDG